MVYVGQNCDFLQTTLLPRIKYCDLLRAPPALYFLHYTLKKIFINMYSVASHINFNIKTWHKLREGRTRPNEGSLKAPVLFMNNCLHEIQT